MSARRLLGVAAVLLALAAAASPAAASRGGQALATGVTAVAGEVEVDVTTSGAIGGLDRVVDRLTAGPVLPGRELTAVTAATPRTPAGTVTDSRGPVALGSVLVVEAVTAETQRVENGVLSAESGVGGGRVALFGLPVLDVGPVTSRVTTHPSEPPSARTRVSGLEVFGSPVTLPEGRAVDLSLALSTDQVLELLEGLAPEVSAVTGLLTSVAGAAGSVDVTVRSTSETDEDSGSARATGVTAQVSLSLAVDLCVPDPRGGECVGALDVAADARVLDLQLAATAVERPASDDPSGAAHWIAVPLLALGAGLLVAAGARTVRRRRTARGARLFRRARRGTRFCTMASAATERGRGTAVRVLGLLAIIAAIAVLAWAIFRQYDAEPGASGAPEEEDPGCARETTVQVTTTPDFAPMVVAAGDRLREEGGCAIYEVTAMPSVLAAEQVRSRAALSHVWIPDSDLWVERVSQDPDAPSLTVGPTLATTPVVVAVPSSLAASTGMSGALPWHEILGGPLGLRMGDPTESTASLLLLHSAHQALSDTPQGAQLLGAESIRMSRQTAREDELLVQASSDGEGATAVATTEQRIVRQRTQNPAAPLGTVVPAEGVGALHYSWVPLPGPDQGIGMEDALSELLESLTGEAGVADLRAAGFRGPDGGQGPDGSGIPAGSVTTVPPPSATAADALLTTWNTVAVDMRMLAVIDVSGSMLQPVGDQTRIGLAAASAGTAMNVFPPTSQVGLWVFSTDHPGGTDWTELAPITTLNAENAAGTHRDALLAAAASLPSHPREGNDTGLYDTVLAAYLEVQQNYEPGYVNSVVLLTDGVNEDENGLSLSELLARLQAAVDPSKPIPVITVGMGPGTDEEVLRLIAAQTGGRSYLARDPADITSVFVDALTHRSRVG